MMTENAKPRIDYRKIAPEALQTLGVVERYAQGSKIERASQDLLKLGASMVNGCAYCVDMHRKEARPGRESEQRLYALSVWREAPFFTPRERAALAWAEAVTEVRTGHVPDEGYRLAREQFDERELVNLPMVIIAINAWNRLAIAFRAIAGTYQPARQHSVQ